MIDRDVYIEEMKESLFSYQRNPESEEWLLILKREFKIIFQLEAECESNQEIFNKCFEIFRPKIELSMSSSGLESVPPLSLFENFPLKLEIFEFLQAKKKIFKCNFCDTPAFETVEDLKNHV